MAHLISFRELALWTQNDVEEVVEDPFAEEVLSKVDMLVRGMSTQLAWEPETIPFDAKLVALVIAKRSYGNPDQEVSSGVGPINGRVLDVAAMLLELTESERSTLEKYDPAGGSAGGGGLWIQRMTSPPETILEQVLYVPDNMQVNLNSTNAAPSWDIPMFSPGDPGDPNNYPEEE